MAFASRTKVTRAKSVGRAEDYYPSPFFDVASNYLPKTIKETFNWCLYYQQTNPIISAVTSKLATYPITDLVFESDNPGLVETLKDIFESKFNIRTFLVETNLDRYTYGNSFTSVSFPIKKMLKCKSCGQEIAAKKTSYIWKNYSFQIECKSCGYSGPTEVRDEPIRSPSLVKLIRWNPNHITIRTNEVTGKIDYYYSTPGSLKNSITLGRPEVIEELPQAFIDAAKNKKAIKFQEGKIFHTKRPSASRDPQDSGWGAPLILPVLKDIFFLQVLRKSQEAVAMEHIVPMRVLFPQITTDGSNPYQHINLQDWQEEVLSQIQKWRKDINHIPVMPIPIGQQNIGGGGRALLLHQEIRIYSEQIIAGMGVPTGFFYGEAQYSGASINLRALENEFLGNREDMLKLVYFISDQVCTFLDLPKSELSFKPFKMADDLQRASFDLSLVSQNMLSTKTFMQSRNYDYMGEQESIITEQDDKSKINEIMTKAQSEAQGEALLIQTKYQMKAQELQQSLTPQQQTPPEELPPEGEMPQEAGEQPPENVEELYQNAVEGGPQTEASPENVEELYQQAVNSGSEAEPPPNVEEMYQQALEKQPLSAAQSPMNIEISRAGGSGVNLQDQAISLASELSGADGITRYKALSRLKKINPSLYYIVNQYLNQVNPPKSFKLPTSSES